MMTNNEGWIKLHRSLLSWEWYDDINAFRLFIHCLLKANHQDRKYRGSVIKRGSFYTSRELLSAETKLSERQVRTALNKLKTTNELTIKTSKQGTIIEIVKYEQYQVNDQQSDQITTNKRPTSDQQTTSNNNDKNNKNEKNERIIYFEDDFVLNEKYEEFLNFRKELKKPIRQASIEANKKQLMKYANNKSDVAIEILEQSIANGWQGLFPIKEKPQQKNNNDRPTGIFDFDPSKA